MEQSKLDRINYLAKKKREEGLTEAEKEEQAILRKEYIESFKRNLESQLENIVIVDEDGNPVKNLKKMN